MACLATPQLAPLAEELLRYCTALVPLAPAAALRCVLQLLRAMFGCGSAVRETATPAQTAGAEDASLYQACVNAPYSQFATFVTNSRKLTASELDPPPRADYDVQRSQQGGATVDKQTLAAYIRLFEPAVIKALKLYTVSSAPEVQQQVLALLIQLVQLRVNYCLLDSDQIFIGYVIKQLEHVEEGQLKEGSAVIPSIFRFLMVLSYERYHSKTVVSIPKVIQLCDGLVASGQPPEAYALPALRPVVEDLFVWARPASVDAAELDAQREVLLSMLLRLIQYTEAQELLAVAVTELRRDGEQRWRAGSRAVLDALLSPLLALHVRLDSAPALQSLHRLLAALCPRALRPADDLLTPLLRQPVGVCSVGDVQRWGGMVCALLRLLVTQVREDVLLARVDDLGLTTTEVNNGCERAVPAQEIVVRLLLSAVELLSGQLQSVASSPLMASTTTFLPQLLAQLLQTGIYILQSGSFVECARCAMWLVSEGMYDVQPICSALRALACSQPLLLLSWCNLLTLLNYSNLPWWRTLTQPPQYSGDDAGCLSLRLVRRGALILLCDYVCENTSDGELLAWLLTSHITELVWLSGEPPVSDMVAALHRNRSASGLLIQAIAARCRLLDQPLMAQRALRCLEGAPASQYGPLLMLLTRRLIPSRHLAVADEALRLACRKLEIILAAEERMLPEENYTELAATIQKEPLLQRQRELVALVGRLGETIYSAPAPETADATPPVPPLTAPTCADRLWFVGLLKDASGSWTAPGGECSRLLRRLEREDVLQLLMAEDADLSLLEHCFPPEGAADVSTESVLYGAAETALFHHLQRLMEQLPSPDQAFASDRYRKYRRRLEEQLAEPATWRLLLQLCGGARAYCRSRRRLSAQPAESAVAAPLLARLALLCLEALRYSVTARLAALPRHVRQLLGAAAAAVRLAPVLDHLGGQQPQWTILAVHALYRVTRVLRGPLPEAAVAAVRSGVEARVYQRIASLMLWAESLQHPQSTVALLRETAICLGRLPLLSTFLRVPPELYRLGWDDHLEQEQECTRFSPVPVRYLQEADVLRQYSLRINRLGWRGRREFEETWMTYLSVLNAGAEDDTSDTEEQAVLLQTNCVAVRGITSLLLQTLTVQTPGQPDVSATLHQPRPQPASTLPPSTISHLRSTNRELDALIEASPLLPSMNFSWQLNLERCQDAALFGHGQLSLRYLQDVIKGRGGAHDARQVALAAAGLDINSCLVFLLQLYAQWTAPEAEVPLPLLVETVRSAVLLSDLLTERQQWEWLLTACLTLYQLHPIDDEILLQHLVPGLCRAAAVLDSGEPAVTETVRRAVEQGLRCALPPVRAASVHGCLLLLQTGPGELSSVCLPPLVDFVQRSLNVIATAPGYNDDYDVTVWAAAVEVLQHHDAGAGQSDFAVLVIQQALRLAAATRSAALYQALMKGLERLVLCGAVDGTAGPLELAVDQLRQRRGPRQLHALSLLSACLLATPANRDAPETLVRVLEAYSHVFNKMRTVPALLSTVLCRAATAGLLHLCPPAEVMSRVISEFVSPHQSHVRALADTVFQVFAACVARQQEALLQHWVLFSLPNFATAQPERRATWLLACFLTAASRRHWLRAAFPLLQWCGQLLTGPDPPPLLSALFLVAARDFYSQLSENQQHQFRLAIETPASGGDPAYRQLLVSLTDGSAGTTSG